MTRLVTILLVVMALAACVSYRPVPIAAGITADAGGMEVRLDSLACCARYRERFLEAVLSISNRRTRPVIVSAADVHIVDADGATVEAAIGDMPRLGKTWLFKPQEIIDFEQRWRDRLATETAVHPGTTVQVRVFFREHVDFDRLTTVRVRIPTAKVTVELPLGATRR